MATGFLALGPKGVNTKNADQFSADVIDDQIDVTSRALLGITVACARCHDHKFDPIPTTDYYALSGIFKSTETFAGVEPGKKSALDRRLLVLADKREHFDVSSEELREVRQRLEEIAQIDAQIASLRKLRGRPAKSRATCRSATASSPTGRRRWSPILM